GPQRPPGTRGRRQAPEARLFRLLGRLGRRERHAVILRCFTEPQRRALERWILTERPEASAGARAKSRSRSTSAAPPRAPRSRSGVCGVEGHLRAGVLTYRASAAAGPFRVTAG
ncbi:unnamed protein product, partial [Prorocentrum cordatum]